MKNRAAAPSESALPAPPERLYQLSELLNKSGIDFVADGSVATSVHVSSIITCNSSYAKPGALYVCVPSEDGADGHVWAAQACELGISAIIADRPIPNVSNNVPVILVDDVVRALGPLAAAFYDFPSSRVRTIGIIGSLGKTTTAWMARGMFEEDQRVVGMLGSIEYAVDIEKMTREGDIWSPSEEDPTAEMDSSMPFHITPYMGKYETPTTTPDALALQAVISGAADRGADTVLVEIDPYAIGDGRLDDISFDILLFTNFFREEVPALERDAIEERLVACFTDSLSDADTQSAVINVGDALGRQIADILEDRGVPVTTYSEHKLPATDKFSDGNIYIEKIKATIFQSEVLVATPVGRLQFVTSFPGSHFALDVAAAAALGVECALPLVKIVAGIEAVEIIPGRGELVDEGQKFGVIVDAASTPEQVGRMLDEAKECGARRTVLIIGAKGDTSVEYRKRLAEVADFKADVIFFTNDSPGRDFPDTIIEDLVEGIPEAKKNIPGGTSKKWLIDPKRCDETWYEKHLLNYQSMIERYIIEDRWTAIRIAIGMARSRDMILVLGRGHEDSMEFWDGVSDHSSKESMETLKGWFDDRIECRNALSSLSYLHNIKELNRDFLPWTRYPEDDREELLVAGIAAEMRSDARRDMYKIPVEKRKELELILAEGVGRDEAVARATAVLRPMRDVEEEGEEEGAVIAEDGGYLPGKAVVSKKADPWWQRADPYPKPSAKAIEDYDEDEEYEEDVDRDEEGVWDDIMDEELNALEEE